MSTETQGHRVRAERRRARLMDHPAVDLAAVRKELLAAITEERDAVAEWRSGDVRVAPDGRYWDAVHDLVGTWAKCPHIPDDLLQLVHTIVEIGKGMRNHILTHHDFDSVVPIPPGGSGGPLHFGDLLAERMYPVHRKPPQLETVGELLEQGVEPAQICKMWNLFDECGRPDIDKVLREKRNPGSETFTPPDLTDKVDRAQFEGDIQRLKVTSRVLDVLYEDPEAIEKVLAIDKKFRRDFEERAWLG